MGTDTTAAVLLTTALAGAALLLSGCGSKEEEMPPEEARDSLVSITQDTAALLDVGGWESSGSPSPRSCDNGNGVTWAYVYSAPIPDSAPLDDAQAVADKWKGLGMTVRTNTDHDPVVFGTGGPVSTLGFETGPGSYSISGTSLCAPGDADDWR